MKSKYSSERESRNLTLLEDRKKAGAPLFMRDDQKLMNELKTNFEIGNPEDTKIEARLAKLRELESSPEHIAKK
jgi:hypothetical protein